MVKPITIWVTPPGPNSWKVLLILEELNVPYTIKAITFEEVKLKPFTTINPNGRVPAIEDPNTNLTIWETGAIIQYLVEQYDTSYHLSFRADQLANRHLCNQWLFFQASGQGPYFGQIGWFTHLHPEKLPSAITRYINEAHRILGVLDSELATRPWLVGDKMTFADLAFTTWNHFLDQLCGTPGTNPVDQLPNVKAWHGRMVGRVAFKKVLLVRQHYMEVQGIVPATGLPEGKTFEELLRLAEEEKRREMARGK